MKGMAALLIWILVGMFFFALLYMVSNEVYTVTYSHAQGAITNTDSLTSLSYLNVIWTYWPLVILIGGYLIFMYSRSQRREFA